MIQAPARPQTRPRRFKKLRLSITSPDNRKIEITGRLVLLHKAEHKSIRRGTYLYRRIPLYEVWELKSGTICLRSSYTEISSTQGVATVEFYTDLKHLITYLEQVPTKDHTALHQHLTKHLAATLEGVSSPRTGDSMNTLTRLLVLSSLVLATASPLLAQEKAQKPQTAQFTAESVKAFAPVLIASVGQADKEFWDKHPSRRTYAYTYGLADIDIRKTDSVLKPLIAVITINVQQRETDTETKAVNEMKMQLECMLEIVDGKFKIARIIAKGGPEWGQETVDMYNAYLPK